MRDKRDHYDPLCDIPDSHDEFLGLLPVSLPSMDDVVDGTEHPSDPHDDELW